eukprot:COSAG01_NODE_4836_length_4701_cov_4.677314_2_plen_131_part_00
MEALLGREHWCVRAAELLCLRSELAHGFVDLGFDQRLRALWHWVRTYTRTHSGGGSGGALAVGMGVEGDPVGRSAAGVADSVVVERLFRPRWLLAVANGLRDSCTVVRQQQPPPPPPPEPEPSTSAPPWL